MTAAFLPAGALPCRQTRRTPHLTRRRGPVASAADGGAAPAATNGAIREALSRLEGSNDTPFHKRVAVLGSTGSIGTQTLDLVRAAPDSFSVSALSANSDVAQLAAQCAEFRPAVAAIADASRYDELKRALADASPGTRAVAGSAGVVEAAADGDAEVVVTGIVGCAGLLPTTAAVKAGKDIALANKETLIAGGPVMVPLVKEHGVAMTAADSEHSAIFQCLQGAPDKSLRRIVLTASGGAFRDWPAEDLRKVTLADALKHPNWSMGPKITIDSSSLYNKAAEVIEAHYLFGVDYDHIEAVIHRQSIIHSLVEFEDSSMLAQLGWADMRLPLLYSITWPHRVDVGLKPFDVTAVGDLTFEKVDFDKYPNMSLAYAAGRKAGTMTCVLNAANEAAVEMFREEKIHFLDIPRVNEAMMDAHREEFLQNPSLEDIVQADAETRRKAIELVGSGKLASEFKTVAA